MVKEEQLSVKRIAIFVIVFLLLYIIISINLGWINEFTMDENTVMDNRISVQHLKKNGEIIEYPSNYFPNIPMGETGIARFTLPEKAPYGRTALCFTSYNCVITIRCKGNVLAEYGREAMEKNHQIGQTLVMLDLPDYSWGEEIEVELFNYEDDSFDKFINLKLMPSVYALHYVLIDKIVKFVFCVSAIGASMFLVILLLCFGSFSKRQRQGVFLALFVLSVCSWIMGYDNMFCLMISNEEFVSNVEYVALFFIPVPFCSFLINDSVGISKKVNKILAIIYSVNFVVTTILNFTTRIHYTLVVRYLRYMIAISLLIVITMRTVSVGMKGILKDYMWVGLASSGTVLVLDIIRFEVSGYVPFMAKLMPNSFSILGVMIFVFSLSGGYLMSVLKEIEGKRRLEEIAFLDGMTGTYNRSGVKKKLEELDSKKDYSIIFFDVNNLKIANDKYGHEQGDRLIKFVAHKIMSELNDEQAFVGRYGGDEFVVGFLNDGKKKADACIRRFNECVEKVNRSKGFPFEVQVAYGFSVNDPKKPLNPADLIKEADKKMYERKKEMKERKNI